MNERPMANDPIWQWLDAYVNQTLSLSELSRLQARLISDRNARALFLDYCGLHSAIWQEVHSSAAFNGLAAKLSKLESRDRKKSFGRKQPRGRIWALAASVAIVGAGIWGTLLRPDVEKDVVALPVQRQVLAHVTGLSDCRWNGKNYTEGDAVLEGSTIQIDDGVCQLTFENGVDIVVQAPARLAAISASRCQIDFGTVAVTVPASALGFTLETDVAEAMGLETRFGVRCGRDQSFSLHAFAGEVVVWPLSQQQVREREVHVVAGSAITTDKPRGGKFIFSDAQLELFAQVAIPRLKDAELPALPVREDLALWLAADVRVTSDNENRVLAWHDVLTGDNRSSEDALQPDSESQPHLIRNGIGSKPAIRFDGTSDYLETAPLLSTGDQTLFFVFSRASDFKQPQTHAESLRTSRQLINYNGPVHDPQQSRREAHEWHELQICDRLASGSYWARVFATFDPDKPGVHLGSIITRQPISINQPVVLTYAYHPSINSAALLINGVVQGIDSAPLALSFTSSKVIGRSCAFPAFFHGDIAEILIYNGALTSEQIAQVNGYLGEKYGIVVSPVQPIIAGRTPTAAQDVVSDSEAPEVHVRRYALPETPPPENN